jgi:hypothetical protein
MAINFGDILGGLGAAYGGTAQQYAQGIQQREQGLTERKRAELEARQRALYEDANTAFNFLSDTNPELTNEMRADNIARLAEDRLDALSNYADTEDEQLETMQVLELANQMKDGTDPTAVTRLAQILTPAYSIYQQRYAPQRQQQSSETNALGQRVYTTGPNAGQVVPGFEATTVEKTPESIRVLEARAAQLYEPGSDEFKNFIARGGPVNEVAPQDVYAESEAMRKEFNSLKPVQDFALQSSAYGRLAASAADPSPAGDLALIFNYMKVLDPGSTVREGEAASIRNAGNVPQRVIAQYNSLFSGEGSLSEEQRADVLNRAGSLYNAAESSFDKVFTRYSGIAERRNLPIEDVLIDYRYTQPSGNATAQPGALRFFNTEAEVIASGLPSGTLVEMPDPSNPNIINQVKVP